MNPSVQTPEMVHPAPPAPSSAPSSWQQAVGLAHDSSRTWVVAGGGIGGLSTALALARHGQPVQVLERAMALSEVGAGIQLGPNAVRVLHRWGLEHELAQVAWFPALLQACCAKRGKVLGVMNLRELGGRYGHPYATIHRADLQSMLARALCAVAGSQAIQTGTEITHWQEDSEGVQVHAQRRSDGLQLQRPACALIGADGLWSRVRQSLVMDGAPSFTGDVAWRALVPMHSLPTTLRQEEVRVWMGDRLHVVTYPVRSGLALNVVVITSGQVQGDVQSWTAQASPEDLRKASQGVHPQLGDLLQFVHQTQGWQVWALHVRPGLGAQQYVSAVHARVALLGDAAHPMRPYLAQGAAMAIEDAAQLVRSWEQSAGVSEALRHYADARWARNAQVQERAKRNGEIFHAQGLMRWGRDWGLKWMGARLMDQPWLYGYPS